MTVGELPRYLFVTGRLAEFSLRQVLDELAPRAGFRAEVAVLPISVAALMTARWVARQLDLEGQSPFDRVVLPGHCGGDLELVRAKTAGAPVERGPIDLRDLPEHFGRARSAAADYGDFAIEILAEINHAPRWGLDDLVAEALRLRAQGADLIDLGCDPGERWAGAGAAVSALRGAGLRVSIDTFDPVEAATATAAGAELVLSVSAANRHAAPDWGAEVVAVPDQPGSLDGLDATIEFLARRGVPFRIDPVLEPIGFGFAASLGRYLEARARWPDAAMLMGVGNLTELTDVDSAGVNVLLAGFCEELRIGSVLTTTVINWARSSVRELDLARRLAHYAVSRRALPKHVEPRLVVLRDPRVHEHGPEILDELQRRIRDPNWRIFAEGGRIHALNNQHSLHDDDPFRLFDQMGPIEASHAFYLGYEMMKARTALTLGKAYRQDQALDWGFLTVAEVSRAERLRAEAQARRAEQRPSADLETDAETNAEIETAAMTTAKVNASAGPAPEGAERPREENDAAGGPAGPCRGREQGDRRA